MKYFLLSVLVRIYSFFIRIDKRFEFDVLNYDSSLIFAFWHENILPLINVFSKLTNKDIRHISVLISTHKDGRLISNVIRHFNIQTIDGSSNRQPVKSFLKMLKKINDQDIVITPDGPRGPRRKLKKGVIELAYLSKRPIVPVACVSKNAWRIGSWDRMVIPKPFSKMTIYFFNPIYVNSKDEFDEKIQIIEDMLNGR